MSEKRKPSMVQISWMDCSAHTIPYSLPSTWLHQFHMTPSPPGVASWFGGKSLIPPKPGQWYSLSQKHEMGDEDAQMWNVPISGGNSVKEHTLGEIGTLVRCWWECQVVQQLENSLAVLRKAKHRITVWPSNSTPRRIPQRSENRDSNRYLHASVHGSIIYNSQK